MDFRALPATWVWGIAGGGAAVALLLFLLRPRPKPVLVPSTFYWDQVVGRRRDPRWREVLALLLQFAVIAALAMALGDPAPPAAGDEEGAGEAGRPVRPPDRVAVVDLSASMAATVPGGATRIDAVRNGLLRDVALLRPGERMAVVTAGAVGRVLVPLTDDTARLGVAVRGLRAEVGRADLPGALSAAARLPALGDRRGEVRVHTDDLAPEPPDLPEGVRYVVQPAGSAADNVGIVAFDTRASEGLPAQHEALVRVRSFATRPAEITLQLETPGEVLGRARLSLGPGEEALRIYRFHPRGDETLEATLRDVSFAGGPAGPDALPTDDRAFAFLQPLREARVLLVSRGNLYLDKALALIPGLKVARVLPGPAAETALRAGRADLAFVDGWAPSAAPAMPAFYVNPPAGGAGPFRVARRVEAPVTTDWDLDHPLFKNLVLRDLNIAVASVLAPGTADRRLVGTAGGPIGLVRDGGGVKAAALGFDFADSDLPLRVAFPQMVYNAVVWARAGVAVGPPPGRPWQARHALALGGAGGTAARVVPLPEPEAGREPRWSRARAVGDGVLGTPVPRTGFLEVRAGEGREPLAVNLFDPSESDLGKVPVVEGPDPAEGEGPPRVEPDPEPGPAPWMLLCLLAVGALVVEYGVAAR